MITIGLFLNEAQKIMSFTVKGHAGYAESGADIVCAAVTTAVMTAVNGLTDVARISADVSAEEGFVSCRLPETLSNAERHDADLLLDSMLLTLENLAAQYAAYVKICVQSANR